MLKISDTIRRTETVDGGILLDIHHGHMFCLNIVGAKILELMQRSSECPGSKGRHTPTQRTTWITCEIGDGCGGALRPCQLWARAALSVR